MKDLFYFQNFYQEEFKPKYEDQKKNIQSRFNYKGQIIQGQEHDYFSNKLYLEAFMNVLDEFTFFQKSEPRTPFIEAYKAGYLFLIQWELKFPLGFTEKDLKADIEWETRFKTYRLFKKLLRPFLRELIRNYFNIFENPHYNRFLQSQEHQDRVFRESPALKIFMIELSQCFLELVTQELDNHQLSNSFLEGIMPLQYIYQIQELQPVHWHALYQRLTDENQLELSPIVEKYGLQYITSLLPGGRHRGDVTTLFAKDGVNVTLKRSLFYLLGNYKSNLVRKFPSIFQENEKLILNKLIKELLSELNPNDEVKLFDAVEVIKEEQEFESLTDELISLYLKDLVIRLPDFEYIRLKRTFRRSDTTLDNMLANLDKLFVEWENKSDKLTET